MTFSNGEIEQITKSGHAWQRFPCLLKVFIIHRGDGHSPVDQSNTTVSVALRNWEGVNGNR